MKNYLSDILKETNTIIIPGIGALTMTDRTSGEVMFMPFLKHDDGALAKYIAQQEGCEESEAKNIVANYVRDIEAKLNAGESYDIVQFGSFRKDNSGDLIFEQYKGSVDTLAPIDLPTGHVLEDQPLQEINHASEEVVDTKQSPIEQEETIAHETEEPTVIEDRN